MSEETNAGANATAGGNPDVSISPIDDGFRNIDPSVDNVPTVDIIPAKEEVADEAAKGAVEEPKDGEDEGKAAADKAARFDQHPDWQRMMKERDDARLEAAMLKGRLEGQAKAGTETGKEAPVPAAAPAYKDVTQMSKEELIEWQEDDPHGYAANLYAQMRAELKAEQAQERQSATIKSTFQQYEEKNPDFRAKWDAGEIQSFMDANPGHNAISAHMIMTESSRLAAAVAKATKEAEERVTKNFQAKRNAEVISDGGQVRSNSTTPDELKNPDKYGGVVSALAMRLQRARQAAAGG